MKRMNKFSFQMFAATFFLACVNVAIASSLSSNQVALGPSVKYCLPSEQDLSILSSRYKVYDQVSSTLCLEDWINWQSNNSFFLMLENIGGISSTLEKSEVLPGSVIASPSRFEPNYFYNWIRDSALTIRSLTNELHRKRGIFAKSLKSVIELYIEVNYFLQRKPNRSGSFNDKKRSGLGEPKYMSNGDQFTGDWGRPQSDGPALRISTIVEYLNYLNNSDGQIDNQFIGNVTNIYHTCVKPDIEYVLENWKEKSFDLWEETYSLHFYNAAVHLRGLHDGLSLAQTIDDTKEFISLLKSNIDDLHRFILSYDTGFASYRVPYVVETPSLLRQGIRTGLDAGSLLASLHAHDSNSNKHASIPFDIDDSRILNTIAYLTADMKSRYPVNHKYSARDTVVGVGLGRYPEDVYDGYTTSEGNPWFICTASASEVLYRLIYKKIAERSDLVISPDNVDFYGYFVDKHSIRNWAGLKISVIAFGSPKYVQTLENIFRYSDTFMQVIRDHVDSNGHMSEQFSKTTGFMQGAHDLTWSYSTFYNSAQWRAKAKSQLGKLVQA